MRTSACLVAMLCAAVLNATGRPAEAKECSVRGFDAVDTAKSFGFTFKVHNSEGGGSCVPDPTSFTISGGLDEEQVCEMIWFGSRKLADEWQVERMEFHGAAFEYVEAPDWPSAHPSVLVRVEIPKGQSKVFSLSRMLLRGDDCDDWEEAFARSEAANGSSDDADSTGESE